MTDATGSKPTGRYALYGGFAALLAFVACNGLIVVTALLAMLGITLSVNPHVQAILISFFAIVTLALVFNGYRQHRKAGPLFTAATGALVIIFTMYISYSKIIESAALLALIIAAGWNWHAARKGGAFNSR